MNANSYLMAVVIAFSFVAWPVMAKYAALSGAWTINLVVIGSLMSTASICWRSLSTEPYNLKAVFILLGAGVLNGLGCILYANKCLEKSVNTGTFVVTVSAFNIILAPLVNMLFNKEFFSLKQGVGFLFLILGLYLFKK